MLVALKQSSSTNTVIEVPFLLRTSKDTLASTTDIDPADVLAESGAVIMLCNIALRADSQSKASGLTLLAQDITERVRLDLLQRELE